MIHRPFEAGIAVDVDAFTATTLRARRCWSTPGGRRHWRTDRYFTAHPFLTEAAARHLAASGAALVGIDSHNIDDTRTRARPVHTVLLGADIPICEHMCHIEALPDDGFRFHAVPPKVRGFGTFPVRAYATV